MVKRVLMVAFHYPPVQGSSGVQRTLKFSRYLLDHGWQPIILTVNPRAYDKTINDQLTEIPEEIIVKRAFALNTAKQLSIFGRYPGFLALPDRWVSWCLGAIPAGRSLIRKYKPQAIWSTYPVATAHLIALSLHRSSGLPWIADFRDSMTEEGYPDNPQVRRAYQWIEKRTVAQCTRAVFTTLGAAEMYKQRYPGLPADHWSVIENGFDEENFREAEKSVTMKEADCKKTTLLHTGLLYPSERDPTAFFSAIRNLLGKGSIVSDNFQIVLRATGADDYYRKLINDLSLQAVVSLEPSIAYRDALVEMMSVDGLLIFQASNCNHQIPAKVYEYIRAKRPILAMTDAAGDTAATLKMAGFDNIVALDSVDEIESGMLAFLQQIDQQSVTMANDQEIARYSRAGRSQQLARLLDSSV